jgi:hypothetical protein
LSQTGRGRHLDVNDAKFRALKTPFDGILFRALPGRKTGVFKAKSIPGIDAGYGCAETGPGEKSLSSP